MVQIDIITDYIEFENTLKGKKAVICFQWNIGYIVTLIYLLRKEEVRSCYNLNFSSGTNVYCL